MAQQFGIAVIGAGPGGFRAARIAAQKGASVALIEKEYLGGTCLNCGCIPSKALLASAHALLAARNAAEIGLDIPSVTPNWPRIQQRKDAIVAGFRKAMANTAKASKLTIFQGRAVATAPNRITVYSDQQTTELHAEKIILATGSQPIQLPNIPFDGQTVISSTEALALPEIPRSMLIVGGGVIGCEMACVYAAMGTTVTVVEALDRLIPMEDQWVGRQLEREFKKIGIQTITGRKVTALDKTTSPPTVTLDDATTIQAEKILVAVGRRATIDPETLEALKLHTNGPVVVVNDKLQTNVPNVYAIGDLIGTTYLAHGAFVEGEVAAANATGADRRITDYERIPRVIFTFPEVASVGKSEQACLDQGLDIHVGKSFFKANGRSVAHNQTAGQIRVIREKTSNKILGITMVGDMVTEFAAFAASLLGTTGRLEETVYPHPTVSETLEEALEQTF